MSDIDRRRFIRNSAAAMTTMAVSGRIFSQQRGARRPLPPTYMRRDIRNADSETMNSFARGIAAMKQLSIKQPSDPRGWDYQANIHGTTQQPVQPQWNTCTHGNYFFLPWHRLYLVFFEDIIRGLSGNLEFGLPFWNYSAPRTPTYDPRVLPQAFRDRSSAFFVAQRALAINAGQPLNDTTINTAVAMQKVNFTGEFTDNFGSRRVPQPQHLAAGFGALESTPHNAVHDAIGGESGWMSQVTMAARDPIFWLHHANIDRLWNEWLIQEGGRSDPITDPAWFSATFTFYDRDTAPHVYSACTLLNNVADFGYAYENQLPVPWQYSDYCLPGAEQSKGRTSPPASSSGSRPVPGLTILGPENIRLGAAPLSLSIDTKAASQRLRAFEPTHRLLLQLEGVEVNRHPGGHYAVFVHLPESPAVLSGASGTFAGNLTFFGVEHTHDVRDVSFRVPDEITRALTTRSGECERVMVTFVPIGEIGLSSEVPVTIRRVSLVELLPT